MNCKPGDLAIVIGSSRGYTENLGKLVEVLQFVGGNGFFQLPDGAWSEGPGWIVNGIVYLTPQGSARRVRLAYANTKPRGLREVGAC